MQGPGKKDGFRLPPGNAEVRVHFIGICGKAMGAIAAALAGGRWKVSGSDEKVYAPMSSYLEQRGIKIATPFDACNVPEDVDLVIVGRRVSAGNQELLHVIRSGIPHCSFPQFLHHFVLDKTRNAVVTGGVGKTSTTAVLTWILEHAGLRPDFLIGGGARNFDGQARFSGGDFAVLEGDEYASCFDDRNPKFVHYRPEVAIITNIIEDHPDIYREFEELRNAFAALIDLLPANGCLIVPAGDQAIRDLARAARCKVVTVGMDCDANAIISDLRTSPTGSRFALMGEEFEIRQCGTMNVRNAAMAAVAAAHFGVSPLQSARALPLFEGVRNRQEEKTLGKVIMVSDKASHPCAIVELADALRQRFPDRRLVSVIQPRATGGRGWVYQRDLPEALSHFDKVILSNSYEHNPLHSLAWAGAPFCIDLLRSGLVARSVDVVIARSPSEISAAMATQVWDGDVVVVTVLEQSAHLLEAVASGIAQSAAIGDKTHGGPHEPVETAA